MPLEVPLQGWRMAYSELTVLWTHGAEPRGIYVAFWRPPPPPLSFMATKHHVHLAATGNEGPLIVAKELRREGHGEVPYWRASPNRMLPFVIANCIYVCT